MQISAELGVSTSLLYCWQREFKDFDTAPNRPTYEELEREIRGLRQDLEFLK